MYFSGSVFYSQQWNNGGENPSVSSTCYNNTDFIKKKVGLNECPVMEILVLQMSGQSPTNGCIKNLGPGIRMINANKQHLYPARQTGAEFYGGLVDNILFRIDRYPVQANLIVDMGTGAATGIAHQRDGFPSTDLFTAFFQQLVNMSI